MNGKSDSLVTKHALTKAEAQLYQVALDDGSLDPSGIAILEDCSKGKSLH